MAWPMARCADAAWSAGRGANAITAQISESEGWGHRVTMRYGNARVRPASRPLPRPQTIPCINSIGVPVQPSVVVGGAECLRGGGLAGYNSSVCGGCGHYASALMLTLLLNNAPEMADAAARWEQEVRASRASRRCTR